MADETTITPTPDAGAGSAAPVIDAPVTPSGETTTDTPGFDKESFGEMLSRVTSDKAPDKTEPTDDTPAPEQAKEEVEKPVDQTNLPDEVPQPEDEDDELELLSAEEINSKFSNAPKGLRSYAAKVVEKFQPIADAIEQLGGIEAIQRLDKIQSIALGAPDLKEGGNVDQLHDQLKSLNPSMLEAFQHKLFYSALDDPKDAEALLNPFIQADERYKDFTYSKLKELADLVVDGRIDLEAIKEQIDVDDPKRAEERRLQAEKDAARDAELAELRKGQEETQRQAQQAVTEQELKRIWGVYGEKVAPVMKKFGLQDFIKADDPQDIQQVKQAYMDDLGYAIGRRLETNPLFQDLARRIGQKDRGDGYDWLVEKCANIYKGIYREEALKRQGMLSAYLKSYGKESKETRRPEPEVDASKAAHAKTTTPPPDARSAHEEGGLGKLIAQKAAEKAA